MAKPILVLDFDGVIHSYQTGWAGPTIISDPPVDGALEFIIDASQYFTIAIYSSRTKELGGVSAMYEWLKDYWIEYGYGEPGKWAIFNAIQWPEQKPAAFLTIDDRAIQFNGQWPVPKDLLEFKPWNKGGKQYTEINQVYAERNHLVALLAQLYPSGLRKTNIPSWDPEWQNCVYIDLPTGQISYHFHDREHILFAGLPPYEKNYDGHNKMQVHERIRDWTRKLSVTTIAPESGLIAFAQSELERIKFDPDDIAAMLATLEVFFDAFDSGGAVYFAAPILQRLIAGKPLSPLTGEDDEWYEPIPDSPCYQNKRCSSVFKTKTGISKHGLTAGDAYDIEGGVRKVTFPYYPQRAEVASPVMEIDVGGTQVEPKTLDAREQTVGSSDCSSPGQTTVGP